MSAAEPRLHVGVGYALLAAGLFGASTPFAKTLVGQVSPLLLAGLLYAGSGVGLSLWLLTRRLRGRKSDDATLIRRDLPWLGGAVLFGGVLGPALLMLGLQQSGAADASLLLNLESVLTAVARLGGLSRERRSSHLPRHADDRPQVAHCCRGTRNRPVGCRGARSGSLAHACAGRSTTISRVPSQAVILCRLPPSRGPSPARSIPDSRSRWVRHYHRWDRCSAPPRSAFWATVLVS